MLNIKTCCSVRMKILGYLPRAAVGMKQGLMFVIFGVVCFRDWWGNYIRIFDTDFIFLKVSSYWLYVWRRLAVLHVLLQCALSLNWKNVMFSRKYLKRLTLLQLRNFPQEHMKIPCHRKHIWDASSFRPL
jgi:hypothetical protein